MGDHALLEQFLSDYAQATGLGSLQADAAGLVALSFNGKLVLHIAPGNDGRGAVLYARLGPPLPPEQAPGLMAQMLEANLLGDDAGGGVLALDARDGAPMLVRRVRLDGLTSVDFRQIIVDLAAAGQDWADFLTAERESEDGPAPSGAPGPESSFIRV